LPLVQIIFSGVAQGCIYRLIALGFVLIYKTTETVSFAQGDPMMVGAFIGLAGMTFLGFPFWLAVPAPIAGTALLGFASSSQLTM
jgi:branched-chain amino acid transport system permease protein